MDYVMTMTLENVNKWIKKFSYDDKVTKTVSVEYENTPNGVTLHAVIFYELFTKNDHTFKGFVIFHDTFISVTVYHKDGHISRTYDIKA